MLQQPYDLYKVGWADNYMLGLINQVAQGLDVAVTQEVTNHLFEVRVQLATDQKSSLSKRDTD